MESQYRNNGGLDGVQKSGEKEGKSAGVKWPELVLRVLALIFTLIAAILVGVDKQTKIVPLTISADLPAFNVPVTAKSSYLSAFTYFVAANALAGAFAAISLVLGCMTSRSGGRGVPLLTIIIIDLIMVALLFSSIGATGAVGLIGFNGNSHLRWNKVCNVYGRFCHQIMAALALSFVGALAYFLLVIIRVSKLNPRF